MNIAIENPEDILVEVGDLEALAKLDAKRESVKHLAKTLDDLTVAQIASLVRSLADTAHSTLAVDEYLLETLRKRVRNATPDQLSAIIQEAKILKVWYQGCGLKEEVMARNYQLAERVATCTNVDGLDMMLEQLANTDKWLPAPIYNSAKETLLKLIPQAGMDTLNKLGDLASKWRMRDPRTVNLAIQKRDHELLNDELQQAGLGKDDCPDGSQFVLSNGSESRLVEDRYRALRMLRKGWRLDRVVSF